MNQYTKYIKDVLHIQPDVSGYIKHRELPLYLRSNYNLEIATMQGIHSCSFIQKSRLI